MTRMETLTRMGVLPSVEECRVFLRVVNQGRVAAGLEPLEVLDFDGAQPLSTDNCLSARNVFHELGYDVSVAGLTPRMADQSNVTVNVDALMAMGCPRIEMDGYVALPESVLCITRVFDAVWVSSVWRGELRDRMVEAGVVAP